MCTLHPKYIPCTNHDQSTRTWSSVLVCFSNGPLSFISSIFLWILHSISFIELVTFILQIKSSFVFSPHNLILWTKKKKNFLQLRGGFWIVLGLRLIVVDQISLVYSFMIIMSGDPKNISHTYDSYVMIFCLKTFFHQYCTVWIRINSSNCYDNLMWWWIVLDHSS